MKPFYPWSDFVVSPLVYRSAAVPRSCSLNEGSRERGSRAKPAINVPVNARETKDGVELSCFCPGADEERFDVQVHEDTVTIKGVIPESSQEEKFLLKEVAFGGFSRTIRLPFAIDAAGVDAVFSKGVLTINVLRRAIPTERKISIKVQ